MGMRLSTPPAVSSLGGYRVNETQLRDIFDIAQLN
jgi:hypothetical protein